MHPIRLEAPWATPQPLFDTERTRALERKAQQAQPPHGLMARAGLAVFRLGCAIYPHAQSVWVACGGGNNGGDGLVAASHWQRKLKATGGQVSVTWTGQDHRLPDDAAWALQQARASGVRFVDRPPGQVDLAVDAVFGIGLSRAPAGPAAALLETLWALPAPVLCVDVPSGLNADTGHWLGHQADTPHHPRHTLALLTLKPGLFTGQGREWAGDIWFDDLGIALAPELDTPSACLHAPRSSSPLRRLQHDSHKGSHGEVVVIGGQNAGPQRPGMTGAAMLAARAALRQGAGRVYVGLLAPLLDTLAPHWDPHCTELMFRDVNDLADSDLVQRAVTVCGCGGGASVAALLPSLLARSPCLVLDADALNALAASGELQTLTQTRRDRGHWTVLTPHPLEAARLLGTDTAHVQFNRLQAAHALAEQFQCAVVLKGSGTVMADPEMGPRINPTGNGLLATAGTGDVLAGMIGANLAQACPTEPDTVVWATADAVYRHGLLANHWPSTSTTLTASDLLERLRGD
jgi:ADP-dependent NAD(P)H-hydrate dehydratase / NAD(P)H-hydrate epimerase